MKILIIGSGGREFMVLKSLSKSKRLNKDSLYWYSNFYNSEMIKYGTLAGIGPLDNYEMILTICKNVPIDIVFIGSEVPISKGLVNVLEGSGYPCIAPKKDLAEIETKKSFARKFLSKYNMENYSPKVYNILNPGLKNEDRNLIIKELKEKYENLKIVVKADGIHGGKGVKVMGNDFETLEEGLDYAFSILEKNEKVVIEEKLEGEEFSLMSFTDGKTCLHTLPVKDFKRAFNEDKGPNTGSMGSVTGPNGKLWFLEDYYLEEAKKINEQTIKFLEQEKRQQYKGIIYGSFIVTKQGLKVIEFNCRFGDPECINILYLMKNDLLEVFERIINGTLNQMSLEFDKEASVFKYKVPKGYPDDPIKNFIVDIKYDVAKSLNMDLEDNIIFANVSKNDDSIIGLGSRTVGIIEKDMDLTLCSQRCNNKMNNIEGDMYYRTDIGFNLVISYENSGVDIEEGNKTVNKIKEHVESTYNNKVVSKFGDFNGRISHQGETFVASTDGVGTKSILVLDYLGKQEGFEMLGQDIVNHCVNDIIVSDAKPLFFLDYFAGSKINSKEVEAFVKGVSNACKEVDMILLGGETAEMPNVYTENRYDLVGMIVGTLNKNISINPDMISENDIVIGLPSSGPHTNSYSLIRKILDRYTKLYDKDNIIHIYEQLCKPHMRYYQVISNILTLKIKIKGLCHITGGGFEDNPKRILPKGLTIEYEDWDYPEWAKFIQEKGMLSDKQMKKVFNCGIGMIMFIDEENLKKLINYEVTDFFRIGKVVKINKDIEIKKEADEIKDEEIEELIF